MLMNKCLLTTSITDKTASMEEISFEFIWYVRDLCLALEAGLAFRHFCVGKRGHNSMAIIIL